MSTKTILTNETLTSRSMDERNIYCHQNINLEIYNRPIDDKNRKNLILCRQDAEIALYCRCQTVHFSCDVNIGI